MASEQEYIDSYVHIIWSSVCTNILINVSDSSIRRLVESIQYIELQTVERNEYIRVQNQNISIARMITQRTHPEPQFNKILETWFQVLTTIVSFQWGKQAKYRELCSRLDSLYESLNRLHPQKDDTPNQKIYEMVNSIWMEYQTITNSTWFVFANNTIPCARWIDIQRKNLQTLYIYTSSLDSQKNQTIREFTKIIHMIMKTPLAELQTCSYFMNYMHHFLKSISNPTQQPIPMSNPESSKAQIHLALDRLISICEKLADQKKL